VELIVKQPRNCNSTKEIWVQKNPDAYIEFIPREIFQKFKYIERLVLEDVRLKVIAPGNFTGARNLKYLVLNNNHMEDLDKDAFKGLEKLEVLSVRVNLISNIENGAFNGLTKLRELKLDFNRITKLNESFFENLSSLEKLTLNHNKIVFIPTTIFSGNSNLQFIDISFNQLSTLDLNMFAGLPNVYTIHLNKNLLIKILNTKSITNLKGLQALDLMNNTCIHQSFFFKNIENFERDTWNCTGRKRPIFTTPPPTLDESSTYALESHRETINFVNLLMVLGFVGVVLTIALVIVIVRLLKRKSRQSPLMIRSDKAQAFYENIDFRQRYLNDQMSPSEYHSKLVWSPTLKRFIMKNPTDMPKEYIRSIPFS
jgi:hypothetical protein